MKLNLCLKIFLVLFVVELHSCQKIDVPKDTPQWVKQRIRTDNKYFRSVNEYSYYGKDVYLFQATGNDAPSYLFDNNGYMICNPDIGEDRCLDFYSVSIKTRIIWEK